MRLAESSHRYPRPMTGAIAGLSAVLVVIAVANLGIIILRGAWDVFGISGAMFNRIPILEEIVIWIDGGARSRVDTVFEFLPTLTWPLILTGAALLIALILRNAFPAIRTSDVGMLVEFAGNWLPLRWEELNTIRVTNDVGGEHFVLLAETTAKRLTNWHRVYSFFYGFGQQPGFYITSNISRFDQLVQTIRTQSERTSRALEGAQPVKIREDLTSPLFSLLLSPGAFFSSRTKGEAAAASAVPPPRGDGPIRAVYPARITTVLNGVTIALALAIAVSYLGYWVRFLALSFPPLRQFTPFNLTYRDADYIELYNAYLTRGVPFMGVASRPDLPAPWWLLVAAHLMLLIGIPAILWLRSALPALESRDDGLAVREPSGSWHVVPWAKVQSFRATELSEQDQVLLLQSSKLPGPARVSSLIYDGSFAPGLLITSAITNFQPLLRHALNRIMPYERQGKPQILQQEARSWLFWLALKRRHALSALVNEARSDEQSKSLNGRQLFKAAAPMALLALLPALLLLAHGLLGDAPPGVGLIGGMIGIWVFGMLEWPLVSFGSVLLDETTGGGEEGNRAFVIYPTSQLPRTLPMLAAVLLQVVGLPLLPVLAWIAAIAWAYWLAAGLFESLYEWKGSQAILGGLFPVLWQLLILIAYLIITR